MTALIITSAIFATTTALSVAAICTAKPIE